MLYLAKSTIGRPVERPVAPGSTITAEGLALVAVNINGQFGVRASTGAANEKFVGVSLAQQLTIEYMPAFEEQLVPENGVISLARLPIAGTVRVVDATTNTVLSAGDPAADAAQYSVSNMTLTVHADLAGHVVTVAYRYSPSVIEAKTIQGDIPPGGAASYLLDSVGVIEVGDVYTSEYDTAADWTAESPVVRLGPNGLFTTAGTGPILTNAIVIQAPNGHDPFLGLRIA